MYVPINRKVVSRAATGIYLILKRDLEPGSKVLVPANICYAAVYPILYAGHIPVFSDIESTSGNVSCECIARCLDANLGVHAAILPHMYGNPIRNFSSIASFLRERGVLIIEDCASSLGAELDDGTLAGFSGDYSLYSFGYSKTVDIGFGGIIASSTEKSLYFEEECSLPLESRATEEDEEALSKVYRTLRQSNASNALRKSIFEAMGISCRNSFLCTMTTARQQKVIDALNYAKNSIELRRAQWLEYREFFTDSVSTTVYQFSKGAVPWRFSFSVSKAHRDEIVSSALQQGIPISDWYPCIAPYFGDCSAYPGAETMGESLLNLPLGSTDIPIKKYCTKMNKIIDSV